MAKTAAAASAAALASALPPGVAVIQIAQGAAVVVDVDVAQMVVPYTVALDGGVVIKSLVDRREAIALTSGTHRLGWSFAHGAKEWEHKLTLKVGSTAHVLEHKSEKKKDQDHSVGVAFLVVA